MWWSGPRKGGFKVKSLSLLWFRLLLFLSLLASIFYSFAASSSTCYSFPVVHGCFTNTPPFNTAVLEPPVYSREVEGSLILFGHSGNTCSSAAVFPSIPP